MSKDKTPKKIKGKIIRILDASTVIINLGSVHGVTDNSVFSILGGPEAVIDPFTNESLGTVSMVKGRVKATSVSEKFTIAASKWTELGMIATSSLLGLGTLRGTEEFVEKHEKELRVQSDDIKPWKALSEDYVKVGDDVEVTVYEAAESASELPGTKEASKDQS